MTRQHVHSLSSQLGSTLDDSRYELPGLPFTTSKLCDGDYQWLRCWVYLTADDYPASTLDKVEEDLGGQR
jgi:hypothetical protein